MHWMRHLDVSMYKLYRLSDGNARLAQDQCPSKSQGQRSLTGLGLIRVPVSGSLCFFPC